MLWIEFLSTLQMPTSGTWSPPCNVVCRRILRRVPVTSCVVVRIACSIEFSVKCSYLEIYLEKIRDLLDTSKCNLHVHEDAVTGVYVKGATEVYVTSEEEMLEVMRQGGENRAVAATGMNEGSSRSHSLFCVTVEQKNSQDDEVKCGRLYLVDLAGSEMVRLVLVPRPLHRPSYMLGADLQDWSDWAAARGGETNQQGVCGYPMACGGGHGR